MIFTFKNIGGLAIVLSLFSCSPEKKEVVRPFTDVLNFETVASHLQGGLIKTVYNPENIESQITVNPNWQLELKPFIEADFNRLSNLSKYTRTETISTLSGWRDIRYNSTDENLPVQSAVYRYNKSECIGVALKVEKNSRGYQLMEFLTYIPNFGYSIENNQNIKLLNNEQFHLSVDFINKPQPWRMFFDIGHEIIPVNFNLLSHNGELEITWHQGKESITTSAIKTDSGFVAELPIFQAYLTFQLFEDSIKGNFHNLDKGADYVIPFTGLKLPVDQVFSLYPSDKSHDFSGKWETYFEDEDGRSSAIGMFDRIGNDLIGTFATETGDYRFLQGKVVGDSFSLTTFDGSHLFLFTGKINGSNITDGHFYSGTHYHATWSAKKNPEFELKNPDEMTALKNSDEKMKFTFPDVHGTPTSLSDERFQGKVVILQILGSWCPNCMDETRYFIDLHNKYNSQGLEIIGLAFERSNDFEKARSSLNKSIRDLQVPYPMLIAGTPKESGTALPMITKIKSYPTSIFLNKDGEVVKIHTGFYGPSTGHYYDEYIQETENFIEDLLK